MQFTPSDRAATPLATAVTDALADFFRNLEGPVPDALYELVLAQVEPPLLRAVLAHCRGNQSKAAEVLGLNRATLRKKLSTYRIVAREQRPARGGRGRQSEAGTAPATAAFGRPRAPVVPAGRAGLAARPARGAVGTATTDEAEAAEA